MRRVAIMIVTLAMFWPASTHALSLPDLEERGYAMLECDFNQRCVIGQACEPAWRYIRWMINQTEGAAYRVRSRGRIGRKLQLMQDARWKERSDALAILNPMREAVASHLTVFDEGGAIYSIQYAASPGSGQFFLGHCRIGGAG